jgi:predicted XRE-type DNA-binding protein
VRKLGITQPCLSDLARHRIERFSLDALVNLAGKARLNVWLMVKKTA